MFDATHKLNAADIMHAVLAAQLGKQLLDKTGELQGQLDELDKTYNELKANHEHLNAQYATLSTVRRNGVVNRATAHSLARSPADSQELKNADLHKGALFSEVDALRQQVRACPKSRCVSEALKSAVFFCR